MATRSSMLHVRVDDEIKTQATEVLAAMGMSMSDAVRILLKRVISDQAFPLALKAPNAATRAAMEEARAAVKARRRLTTRRSALRSMPVGPTCANVAGPSNGDEDE